MGMQMRYDEPFSGSTDNAYNIKKGATNAGEAIDELYENLSKIPKSFTYSGTTAANGTLSISNKPSDFVSFVSATQNTNGYLKAIPMSQSGEFKALQFVDSTNANFGNQAISGTIYYL